MSIGARKKVSSALCSLGLDRLYSSVIETTPRILMYHRIINPESVPFPIQSGMYVTPETFRMHCEVLSKEFNVIPLRKILEAETPQKKSVAITFDDGWKDNFDLAFPILKEFSLPASIFLPTAFIGGEKLFWTDLIGIYIRERSKGFRVESLEKLGAEDLESLLNKLFRLPAKERAEIINQVQFVIKSEEPRQFMNWDEVRELEASELISLANHTHNHLLFGDLTPEQCLLELEQAERRLSEHCKSPMPRVVALPGGSMPSSALPESFKFLTTNPRSKPPYCGRIGLHEDISSTPEMFKFRLSFKR